MKIHSSIRIRPAVAAAIIIALTSAAAIVYAIAPVALNPRSRANSRAIVQWSNSTGGYFDVNSNWSSGSAPGASDSASFALNSIYNVDWDSITGNTTTDDMFVTAGEVTLRSPNSSTTGVVYTHTLNDSLVVGAGSFLDIGNGADALHFVVGGETLIDDGTVMVTRNGSLTANGEVNLGSSINSHGYLNLQDTLFVANDVVCLGLGDSASGRIVAADETIANMTNVDIGCSANANGRFEVIGAGTVVNATDELDVGHRGRGVMEVRLGGELNTNASAVGYLASGDGNATVKHAGSRWNVDNRLDVGASFGTTGSLKIQEGGVVSVGTTATVGVFTDLPGSDTIIEGPGSMLDVTGDIAIGGSTFAGVSVGDGADLVSGGEIGIGGFGSLEVDGLNSPGVFASKIRNEGLVTCTGGLPDLFPGLLNLGVFECSGSADTWIYGDLNNLGTMYVEPGASTRILGAVTGDGDYAGSGLHRFNGEVNPGLPSGAGQFHTLDMFGSLHLESLCNLHLEVAGAAPSDYDRLSVLGDVQLLGADLQLSLHAGHIPELGDDYTIIEVDGSLTGEFDGMPEGSDVYSLAGQPMMITYSGGDGNDIVLRSNPLRRPISFIVTRGLRSSGGFVELYESDNHDFVMERRSTDIQSITQVEFTGWAPPGSSGMSVTLESSVFARNAVNQTIELYNYGTSSWEAIDTRQASRFGDSNVTVTPAGDYTRFIDPTNLRIRSRIRYQSPSPRQQFSSSIDQFNWTFAE